MLSTWKARHGAKVLRCADHCSAAWNGRGPVFLMRSPGLKATKFGAIDKKDFLILPFAFFYFYTVFAAAFDFPTVSRQGFFHFGIVSWLGVLLCLAGLSFVCLSLVSARASESALNRTVRMSDRAVR